MIQKEEEYIVGEKILCYHGPLLYEARCLKISNDDDTVRYFVHYAGWKKSWDEWVLRERILKFNDENLLKKARLLQESSRVNKKAVRAASRTFKDRIFSGKEDPSYKLHLKIPSCLQTQLFSDKDSIIKKHLLIQIPVTPNVQQLLEGYCQNRYDNEFLNIDSMILNEVCNELQNYFDVLLGSKLLYEEEYKQYKEFTQSNPELPVSQCYGFIHLLRLISKVNIFSFQFSFFLVYMPKALEPFTIDKEVIHQLSLILSDILKYILDENAFEEKRISC